MIKFIAGVHGVGKGTYIEECYKNDNSALSSYTCSDLIKRISQESVQEDKLVVDVSNNQTLLKKAIDKYIKDDTYILDGHFTLIGKDKRIVDIPIQTFEDLKIDEIELLVEKPSTVFERITLRDNVSPLSIQEIKTMQDKEIYLAKKYADELKILISARRKIGNEWSKVIIHSLKVDQEYFQHTLEGKKDYEIRYNDRNFKENDLVILNEIGQNRVLTGRYLIKRVGLVTENFKPIKDIGFVVFALMEI